MPLMMPNPFAPDDASTSSFISPGGWRGVIYSFIYSMQQFQVDILVLHTSSWIAFDRPDALVPV